MYEEIDHDEYEEKFQHQVNWEFQPFQQQCNRHQQQQLVLA